MAENNLNRAEEKVEELSQSGGGHALAIGFYIAALVLIIGTALTLYGLLGPGRRRARNCDRTEHNLFLRSKLWPRIIWVEPGKK